MTSAPAEPAAGPRRQVWFPDTSALVTLAVHLPLQQAVVATLSTHDRVLVDAVAAELHGLAATAGPVSGWAGTALKQLDWLGTPVRVDDPVGTRLAVELQEQIAGGRALSHPMQHYGEAAIISLASRARRVHLGAARHGTRGGGGDGGDDPPQARALMNSQRTPRSTRQRSAGKTAERLVQVSRRTGWSR